MDDRGGVPHEPLGRRFEFRPGWTVRYERSTAYPPGKEGAAPVMLPVLLRWVEGPRGQAYVEPAGEFEDALLRAMEDTGWPW